MSPRSVYFATCAPGIEPLLHGEARALKLAKIERQVGGVRFEGSLEDAWRANLWLRTAVRVLHRLTRFPASDGEALFEGASSVDWTRYLRSDGTLWIDAQTKESALDHSHYVEQRVKDAIVDQLRQPDGTRPEISREDPDLRVHVHLWRDRVTLSLDSSGESLHKRGWRQKQGRAPLAETLAAAMLLHSGWDGRSPLLDPFCGSGTLLVEAASLAAGRAPGLTRRRFGFESWPGHDERAFRAFVEKARSAERPLKKLTLWGADIDPERVSEARENAASAGFEDRIQLEVADAKQFAPRRGWNGFVVTNPPYGERVGDPAQLTTLYASFGRALREHCAGYRYAILSGNARWLEPLALKASESLALTNGSIECELLTGEIAQVETSA